VNGGLVLQAIVAGLAAGAVYGLVALGFSLVYRLTSVLQFAHGDLVGAASFVAVAVAFGSGPPVASGVAVSRYVLAALAVLVVSALASVGVYRIAVRPFAGNAIGWIGGTVAVAFAIEGALGALFPRESYSLPDPLPFADRAPIGLPGGASLPPRVLYVLAVGALVALGARMLMRRGTFGAALSAIATEPDGARLVGLPVERFLAIAFALAGVLAGVAGLIGAPDAGSIGVQTGAVFGLKAIAAAIVGGLVNPDRVYLAALGIGVVESCVATLPPNGSGVGWRDVAPLLLAVLLLAVRAPRAAREQLG
jgi:branched-subunit amino acid ABC-type transport system permease component